MTRKMNYIPLIPNYGWIRERMKEDLNYRLNCRQEYTSLGRPLYERINLQVVMTQQCPYHCPFCIERQNPMSGVDNFKQQLISLESVLKEHPNARLSITGGEPGLYPEHVKELVSVYLENSNNVFASINTTGYEPKLASMGHINLSVNDYVPWIDLDLFKGCTYQTVLDNEDMTLQNIKDIMDRIGKRTNKGVTNFSFRVISELTKCNYQVDIWNELQKDDEIKINTFRIGDFFVYVTFDYKNYHARVTLGDMYQQQHNNYGDGYSNIIIHPDGSVGLNWK